MLYVSQNNNLRELPRELAQLPHLDETYFGTLQLTSPPQEIAEQGIDAIQNYFATLEEAAEVDYLYEAKKPFHDAATSEKLETFLELKLMEALDLGTSGQELSKLVDTYIPRIESKIKKDLIAKSQRRFAEEETKFPYELK